LARLQTQMRRKLGGAPRAIPAFAPASDGDDLLAARAFIEDAVLRMRALRSDDSEAVHGWLDDVSEGARGLQARAIARAAENTRSLESPRAVAAGLHTVATLIAQYEQGLVDVEAQMETLAREPLPAPVMPEHVLAEPPTRPLEHDRDKFDVAREVLMGLVPRTDTAGHEGALQTLIEMEFCTGAVDVPNMPEDDGISELSAESVDEPVTVETQQPEPEAVRRMEPDLPAFDVEPLLPGLVDHAHRVAMRAGKKLTASYAARDARLSPALAEDWQVAVETAICALVDTTLETPAERQARGETAAAHMAFTVEGSDDGLTLMLRCPGRRLPRFDVEAPHDLDMRIEDGVVIVRFLARVG